MRNVGLTLFLLLILVYWGIGYNFGTAYAQTSTPEQQQLTLVEYLWELPVIGIPLAVVIPLWLLRPIARDYDLLRAGQPLPDPTASADRILRYPRRIVWYFTPASILAYVIGSLQSLWFTHIPVEDFYKGFPLGLPMGLLFSLASYLVLVRYLDPVRRAHVQRYGYAHAPPPIISIERKVIVTSVTIVALGLAMLWLIAYAQGENLLTDQLYARMEETTLPGALAVAGHPEQPGWQQELARVRLGDHGYSFLVDGQGRVRSDHPRGAASLADEGWDPAVVAPMLGETSGRYLDNQFTARLVAYAAVAGTEDHVVVVTYRDDFAGPLVTMSLAMLGTTVLALGIALGLTFTGSRAIAAPIHELTAAMRRARDDGTGGATTMMTDDEVGALAASYDNMMARLREKTSALEHSVERLRGMDALKTRFINIASHELRTPMTPIRTELHLLRTGRRGPLTPQMEQGLEMVGRNVDRLNRLIRELLEASRMQAGHLKLQVKEIPLGPVLESAARTMEGEAKAKGVSLQVESTELRVMADDDRVSQVLINLLENAVQFTPAGGRVSVLAERLGAEAQVRVVDTGVGIEPDALPRLFQPFSQAEPGVPRTEGGTGLGLYICRGIVDGHGGRIWAESEGKGRGATMVFTLPLAGLAPGLAEDVAPVVQPFGEAPWPPDAPAPASPEPPAF
jgi:signal transduction histidine kinase